MLLQNCHLGLDFMDELLDTVLTAENVDPEFRTWITAEEHPKFPITLLQSSIKVSVNANIIFLFCFVVTLCHVNVIVCCLWVFFVLSKGHASSQ